MKTTSQGGDEGMTTIERWIGRRGFLKLHVALTLPLAVGGCDVIDELFEIEDEELAEDDAGLGDHPLVGEWETGVQGCDPSSALVIRGNGSGVMYVIDCNGICPSSEITFDWNATGRTSGTLTLNYTSSEICGEPQEVPDPDSSPFSVSGDRLEFAGSTWTRGAAIACWKESPSSAARLTTWPSADTIRRAPEPPRTYSSRPARETIIGDWREGARSPGPS
jgi:hypothetical protein